MSNPLARTQCVEISTDVSTEMLKNHCTVFVMTSVAVNKADQYVLQKMWKEMTITETSARSPVEIILNTHG